MMKSFVECAKKVVEQFEEIETLRKEIETLHDRLFVYEPYDKIK